MSEKTFKIVNGDISDGYHTFDELYEHRCLLFINLCLVAGNAYVKHDHFDGWDCIYWESPRGQISYHVPVRMRIFYDNLIPVANDHKYDGHSSADVARRLGHVALGKQMECVT